MSRAGRGGNTSLRGAASSAESPEGLLIAGVLLGPLLLYLLARDDRIRRGVTLAWYDVVETLAIGSGILAIDAGLFFMLS